MRPDIKHASSLLKNILRKLYIGYLKNKEKKIFNRLVLLGEIDEPVSEQIKTTIDLLKSKGVIKNYKQENKIVDEDIMVYLNCSVITDNFIEYLKNLSLIPEFYLTFENGDTIILNDRYVMRRPHFYGDNEIFFRCVYENQNKRLYRDDFTSFLRKYNNDDKLEFSKPFKYCTRDLQFTGELRKVFFSSSKHGVEFRNPVFKIDIESLKIDRQKLNQQLKKLKRLNSSVRNGEKKG